MALAVMSVGVYAQPDHAESMRRQEINRQKEAALKAAAGMSETANALKVKVDQGKSGVILEAVNSGDKSLIPYLKLLASDSRARSRNGSAAFEAHVGLAILGDDEAFAQILEEVGKKDSHRVLASAHAKLALIGSKESYRILYEALDDHTNEPSEASDMFFSTVSHGVMSLLAKTVKNPPTGKDKYSVDAWKAWFERNRHLIE